MCSVTVDARAERRYRRLALEKSETYRAQVRTSRWWTGLSRQHRKTSRNSGHESEIGAAWIREQYDRQNGRCFYTGVPFVIDATIRGMRRPSLDRVDSSKGYTRENTVLCLTAINYLKNDYPAEDVVRLLLDIVDLYG